MYLHLKEVFNRVKGVKALSFESPFTDDHHEGAMASLMTIRLSNCLGVFVRSMRMLMRKGRRRTPPCVYALYLYVLIEYLVSSVFRGLKQ